MIYFIKPLRVCIDFEEETYWADRKCPNGAIEIDLIEIDPGNSVTNHAETTVAYKPKNVLHLNGWDGVTFVTVLHNIGRLKDESFYLGSSVDGLKNLCRCAFSDELPAPGETGEWRNRQLKSQPEKWAALNAAVNEEPEK